MSPQLRQRLLTEYPEWHNNPLLLSKNEMEHPHAVLVEFFDWYGLKDIRACLKEWLQLALRTDEVLEIDFLTIHDHVLKLAEAAWVLHVNKKEKVKRKKQK